MQPKELGSQHISKNHILIVISNLAAHLQEQLVNCFNVYALQRVCGLSLQYQLVDHRRIRGCGRTLNNC